MAILSILPLLSLALPTLAQVPPWDQHPFPLPYEEPKNSSPSLAAKPFSPHLFGKPLSKPGTSELINTTTNLSINFSQFVQQILDEFKVPGCGVTTVKIVDDEETGEKKTESVSTGFGKKDLKGTEVDGQTLFTIASNTKAFTASALSLFIDHPPPLIPSFPTSPALPFPPSPAPPITWSTKVHSLLPSFQLSEWQNTQMVDLKDLLGHRTGVPRHEWAFGMGDSMEGRERTGEKGVLEKLKDLKIRREVRQEWMYNNVMFNIGGHLVHKLSSIPFTEFVTSRILKPLGMNSTTFSPYIQSSHSSLPPSKLHPNLSLPFLVHSNGSTYKLPYFLPPGSEGLETSAPAGGIITNANDLSRWIEYLIRARRAAIGTEQVNGDEGEWPIPPSQILFISTAHTALPPHQGGGYKNPSLRPIELGPSYYGLGLGVESFHGIEIINHGGSVPGYGSQILWSSEAGAGVGALCNSDGIGNLVADAITWWGFEELVGLKHLDWIGRIKETLKEIGDKNITQDPELKKFFEPNDNTARFPSSLNISAYWGNYYTPSYGIISICPGVLPSDDLPLNLPRVAVCLYGPRIRAKSAIVHDPENEGSLSWKLRKERGEPELVAWKRDGLFWKAVELWHEGGERWRGVGIAIWENEGHEHGFPDQDSYPSSEVKSNLLVYTDAPVAFDFILDPTAGDSEGPEGKDGARIKEVEIRGVWHEGLSSDWIEEGKGAEVVLKKMKSGNIAY